MTCHPAPPGQAVKKLVYFALHFGHTSYRLKKLVYFALQFDYVSYRLKKLVYFALQLDYISYRLNWSVHTVLLVLILLSAKQYETLLDVEMM